MAVVASLLLGGGSWAQAQDLNPLAPGLSLRQRLEVLVERVKSEQQQVQTLAADFRQEKTSSLLLEPEASHGSFWYRAPERARWEYEEPMPMVLVIDGEELTTWYEDLSTAETVDIGRYADQVFQYLGASGSLETLMKYFSVTAHFPEAPAEGAVAGEQAGSSDDPGSYRLDLEPKYPRIKKRLQAMVLWIDGQTFLPTRLKYIEPGGDTTEYWFENLRVNAELSEGLFDLNLPADVEHRRVELKVR